ncbi:Rpn family recombination-promoting nuclease/putative transposase OS=Streptomyces tendae OX=1932 GN=GUR47_17925 PE=4 SV=1 [Streptomyces tendae]
MVGSSHEALHWVFQKDPALLTRRIQRVLTACPFPEPR